MPHGRALVRFAFAVILITALGTPARSQTVYTFTTFAGPSGGVGVDDGIGAEARFDHPSAITTAAGGNMYVADTQNHVIRRVTPAGVVTTLAGRAGFSGSADGVGGAARFKQPYGIAVDGAGNVLVCDTGNFTIRKIDASGTVTTIAGLAGVSGSTDATTGSAARFSFPNGIAVDATNNIFVVDTTSHTIRKITPAGVVTTFAGLAETAGSADGTGNAARFSYPYGLGIDAANNLFVADQGNRTIRKVTPLGVVTTFAGQAGTLSQNLDGTGSAARFKSPLGIVVDATGKIFVSDGTSNTIRMITTGAVVTTPLGLTDAIGSADGNGSAARFWGPQSLTVDSTGNLYIADTANSTIRKATPAADVTTLAGAVGGFGSTDGALADARFSNPYALAVDPINGDVFVGETYTIRKISGGVVSTLAGMPGVFGSADGTGPAASFRYVNGIAVATNHNLYVADTNNHTIRMVTPGGVVTTVAGVAGTAGSVDGIGGAARFNFPFGVAVDFFGNLFVADDSNHMVRAVAPGGIVSTLAGAACCIGNVDGTGSAARFYAPRGIALDGGGNIYVGDELAHTIRRLTFPGGTVATSAGAALQPGSTDGYGYMARFNYPQGVATDNLWNVYVSDAGNSTIRRVDTSGIVTTVGGSPAITGDEDGTGADARFSSPAAVAVDSSGNLYVADTFNNKIKIGRPALPDKAQIDNPTGLVGHLRALTASPATGTTWTWTLIRQPGTSSAAIQNADQPAAQFTPDATGVYVFRLRATDGFSSSVTTVSLNVGQLFTSTLLASAPNPSLYGVSATLTATVLSEGVATGQVTFFDNGLGIGGAALDNLSTAKLILPANLGGGTHLFTATYGGDFSFQTSSSPVLTHIVDRSPTATGLGSSPNPSTVGDAVTFTSGVSWNAATGTVTFNDGATPLATVAITGTATRVATFTTTALSAGLHSITATYNGDANFAPSTSPALEESVRALFGAPPGLTATAASTTSVTVSWIIVVDADHYELVQTSGGVVVVTTPVTTPVTVSGLTPGTTYVYKIRAVTAAAVASAWSAWEPATTILFSDDPAVAGVTTAKAAHIAELRQAVNAMRSCVGLSAAAFTDPTLSAGAAIKAIHINELRTALTQARAAMTLSTPYTDNPVAVGTTMKAVHIMELRDAMR